MARYRYRRGRRGYRKSTNTIMMKFQSFMDLSTKPDEMQIISISAGGKELLNRLPAQFGAYKYYKIGNISAKLVPASTLPVDPTGLSYEAGEQTVDPRDQLTPGMMRITNGEDVFEDLTGMSAENQHKLYNAMMLDPRWFKWMLQRGVKRHATPRYWQIGQLHQDKWPGATLNIPNYTDSDHDSDTFIKGTIHKQYHTDGSQSDGHNSSTTNFFGPGSAPEGFFQTGHKGYLGWLPTDGFEYGQAFLCAPPEIEVMKILLPPAYKTSYYYRLYISETVYFREPKVMGFTDDDFPYRPLDVFAYPNKPEVKPPTQLDPTRITDTETGGNYGGN